MFKAIIALSIFLQSGGMTIPTADNDRSTRESETYVYICKSSTAKKYHYTKGCRGLGACTHSIIQVSLAEAKNKYGRTLCGWED